MKTATKQKLILGSCFIAVFLIIMELVILSVNYANLENRLSESQTNLKTQLHPWAVRLIAMTVTPST